MASQRARDLFVIGLRNAHAMERQAEEIVERQPETLEEYPDLQTRVRQHLGETRQQIKRIDDCLDALGESESAVKDAAGSFMGNLSALSQSMAGDAISDRRVDCPTITEACGWGPAPRYIVRDRDRVYGDVFTRRLRAMGIRDRHVARERVARASLRQRSQCRLSSVADLAREAGSVPDPLRRGAHQAADPRLQYRHGHVGLLFRTVAIRRSQASPR
jgi:hypothetical protein